MADMPGANSAAAADNISLQSLLDYTQTLIEGEELMFIMDVPYVPSQETPIVLAQAAAPAGTPQPDYILNYCKETQSTGDPRSAMRAVDPAYMLKNYIQIRDFKENRIVELGDIKNVTLLQGTQHGEIASKTTNYGRTTFRYHPTPDYVGNDQAVFQAEYQGKVYKIVVKLVVSLTVGESPLMEWEEPVCPAPTLIKVNGKPVSGSTGYDSGYSFGSLSVTFADGAVGQATGEGVNANNHPRQQRRRPQLHGHHVASRWSCTLMMALPNFSLPCGFFVIH